MGKKTKNKKKNHPTDPVPSMPHSPDVPTSLAARSSKHVTASATNSTETKELMEVIFEFEGYISKLENQLRENEVQRKLEVAAALETGREEGYTRGCQERLEVIRKQLEDVADADTSRRTSVTSENANTSNSPIPVLSVAQSIHVSRDILILRSGQRNPWSSLSRRHRRSHPRTPLVHSPPNSFYYVIPNSVTPPSLPIQTIETVRHPHGIGAAKPVIRTPSIHRTPLVPVTYPIATQYRHYGPLAPANTQVSVTQSRNINPSLYRLSTFIPRFLSYSLSISSQIFSALGSSVLFGQRGCCLEGGGHLC
jgi:hypothetical protein